ncbi:hypothetical protein D9M71_444980 [compost metagenome]
MPFGHQVGGEPGQEEHVGGVAGELAQADAQHVAVLEQRRDLRPVERRGLLPAIDHPATGGDVVQLSLVGCGRLVRLMVFAPPYQAVQDAHQANGQQQKAPAVGVQHPEQQRRQKRQPGVLGKGVDTRGPGPLALRKPGGNYPAVGGKARCFGHPHQKAHAQQRQEALRQALQPGEQRPQGQCQPVGELGTQPVDKDAARDLRCGVSPRESGKDHPHHRRVQAQIGTDAGCGDAHHAAVEVVDHGTAGNQRQDHEAGTGPDGLRRRTGERCRYESIVGRHCFCSLLLSGVLRQHSPPGGGFNARRSRTVGAACPTSPSCVHRNRASTALPA